MAKQYRVTPQVRLINRLAWLLAYLGVGGPMVVLTTTGRRTGRERSTPVSPIEVGGNKYLVAPYGEVGWVRNVRANPRVQMRKGRSVRKVTLSETSGEEAAAAVQAYHKREAFARRYMDVPDNPTVADFASAASKFPVFRVD